MNIAVAVGLALVAILFVLFILWLNSLPTDPDDRTPDEVSEDKHW